MATWRGRELSAMRGSLSSQAVQKMHQLFSFFGLFQCLEFVEKPRETKAKERAAVTICPLCVFPLPSLSLCLRWVLAFHCFLSKVYF